MDDPNSTAHLQRLLDQLRAGDEAAREALLQRSLDRFRALARRMFRQQGDLRRLEDTDDVVQKALLRLHNALADIRPADVRSFYGLAARQVRWVLCDLARERAATRPLSYGAAHPEPEDPSGEPSDLLEWSQLHEAIEGLPDE